MEISIKKSLIHWCKRICLIWIWKIWFSGLNINFVRFVGNVFISASWIYISNKVNDLCDRNFTRVGDIIFLLGQQDENISDCVVFIYIYIYVNWTILCIQLDVNKVISCCINMLILLDWKVLAKYAVFNVVTDIYNQS